MLLSQCCFHEKSWYLGGRVSFRILNPLTLPLYTTMSSLFSACTLPSITLNHSTPPFVVSLFHPKPIPLLALCPPPPLRLHARLPAGPGEELSRAPATSLRSCLAMDEKQRQKRLWFKVHPGNYSEWLKSWPKQTAMYNTTTPTS